MRLLLLHFVVFTAVFGACYDARADDSDQLTPRQQVDALHEALIKAMKIEGDDGFTARSKLLAPVIRGSFDTTLISRLVLGAEWAKLTAAQRESFSDLMARYMTASYASKFNKFSGQEFKFKNESAQGDRVMIIRAEFVSGGGKTRKFDYQVRKGVAGWRIVNVAVDGISDLSLKRAEFGDVLKKGGFDDLVAGLEKRIANMAEGKE